AEGVVGGVQVVVDGLGYAHHLHALLVELGGHPESVLPADRDQRVHALGDQVRLDLLHAAVDLERVGTGGAEDGAATREDAAYRLHVQRSGEVLQRAAPPVAEAYELVAELADALADHRSDHRVQARAVTATGEHADSHDCSSLRSWVSGRSVGGWPVAWPGARAGRRTAGRRLDYGRSAPSLRPAASVTLSLPGIGGGITRTITWIGTPAAAATVPAGGHDPPAGQIVPGIHQGIVAAGRRGRQLRPAAVIPQLAQVLGEPGDLPGQLRHRSPQLRQRHMVV